MALYIPHSAFHLARLLYVRPESFGPYYVHHLYPEDGGGEFLQNVVAYLPTYTELHLNSTEFFISIPREKQISQNVLKIMNIILTILVRNM